jgi:hypothetical protein
MSPQIISIVWKTATVVLIVVATRWLLNGKDVETAKTIGDTHVYGIRRRIKVMGFGTASLFIAVLIGFHQEFFNPRSLWLIAIPSFFILAAIWLANGSVITTEDGIVKRTLWSAQTLPWQEISSIRFYERQKYIELLGENRKLTIDVRFVALEQLLDEIVHHTKAQVERK